MPVPYPTLNVNGTDTQNLYTLFKFVNNGVSGVFMPIMLGVIWIIAFIGAMSEGRQASRSFIFASFVISILSILLALIGLLNVQYMYISFLMVGIGIIWNKLENAPGL